MLSAERWGGVGGIFFQNFAWRRFACKLWRWDGTGRRDGGEVTQMNNEGALLKTAPNNCVKIMKKKPSYFLFFGSEECKEHQNLEKDTEYWRNGSILKNQDQKFSSKTRLLLRKYIISFLATACGIVAYS